MKFNEKQQEALALADAGHSLLIQGAVGTGKTTIVSAIISRLKSKGLKVAVTGSTGMAAKISKVNIVLDYNISALRNCRIWQQLI